MINIFPVLYRIVIATNRRTHCNVNTHNVNIISGFYTGLILLIILTNIKTLYKQLIVKHSSHGVTFSFYVEYFYFLIK